MPAVGPVKRADRIRYLRVLGFGGSYAGARHQIMARGNVTLRISKDGSPRDLYLLEAHEMGQILDVSLIRFQTERHNLRQVRPQLIQSGCLGVRARQTRNDADVETRVRIPFDVRGIKSRHAVRISSFSIPVGCSAGLVSRR